ncbi:NADH-quinone oxidoreductase subunit NuoN [Smaragdicoccus niigatensis]|uniref:NADH-quinone oxidoreductase subunit NuoN n=1 Tax=Smaragdicoccus niigatensis TaxID=359359 RepID=UPI0003793BE0|nr:NADH-quinone oxidoreductase subunit NuoN [Smaragdicoccus niigatensis]
MSIEYHLIAPILLVFGSAVVGVLVEAFAPRTWRRHAQIVIAAFGLVTAFVAVAHLWRTTATAMAGAVIIDGAALFLQGTILVLALLALLLISDSSVFTAQAAAVPGGTSEAEAEAAGVQHTEIYPLMLFATGGMLLFPAAGDLLTMFIALEVFSLPLYLLCGLARYRRLLSQESALKYFLMGAFSSAFFLFGVAMLYGYAGGVRLYDIANAHGPRGLLLIGIALVAVGLLFKVGLVPFHSWVPDVYQGAPTPVTAFMASATKVAAFGALLRVSMTAFDDWKPILYGVAAATMIIGVLMAVTQTDVKRMLAYSSIAHAGYILVGVVAFSPAATLFYAAVYGLATVAAFTLTGMVHDRDGETGQLREWAGLGRRHPLFAGVFTIVMLALAGLPLTSGFIGKLGVFVAAFNAGEWPLVVVGVISSAIAAFFYLRVVVMMFFTPQSDDSVTVFEGHRPSIAAAAIAIAATILLGVVPQPLFQLAENAFLSIL